MLSRASTSVVLSVLAAVLLGHADAFRGSLPRIFGQQLVEPAYDMSQVPYADVASFFEGWEPIDAGGLPATPKTNIRASSRRDRPVIFLETADKSSSVAGTTDGLSAVKVNGSVNGSATAIGAVNSTASGSAAKGKEIPRSWYQVIRLTLSFTLVVKCLCIMSNVVVQASPYPIVQQIVKKKSTGEADSAPFIGICFCACQSGFYGLFAYIVTGKSGFLVLTYSNVVGVTAGSYYIIRFLQNCDSDKVLKTTFNYLKAASCIWGVEAMVIAAVPHFRALFFVGFTSSCCSLIGAASLVTTVPEVLKTKCSQNLPIPVLTTAAASNALWSLCGINLWDPYITFPNIVGFCACIFALSLTFVYPAALPEHCAVQEDLSPTMIGAKRYKKAENWGGSTGGT